MFSWWILSHPLRLVVIAFGVFRPLRKCPFCRYRVPACLVKPGKTCDISEMTTRRPKAQRRRTAAAALGFGLASWLSGCAFFHDFSRGSSNSERAGVWLGYFSGEDLRAECGSGSPDAFRLVWRPAGGGFRVLEVFGNEAGGALMLHYSFDAGDLSRGAPPAAPPEPRQRLPLSPDGFAGLSYWFDRLGMFTPVPGTPEQPGAALEWLIAGCLGGNWTLNIHLPGRNDEAGGVAVKATPAPSGAGRPAPAA